MKTFTSLTELLNTTDFKQLDTPVAVSAPFIHNQRVIVGLYSPIFKYACIDVPVSEFESIKEFIYYPHDFRLAVHGIQRIWGASKLYHYDLNAGLILDTQVMAYLLDSGKHRSEYSLSRLVYDYFSEEYPVWHKDLADNDYPDSIRAILAYDAHLIYDLAYELLELMHEADNDLKFVYFYNELPLVRVLLEMSHIGIGVDGQAAAAIYSTTQNQRNMLEECITDGTEDINLWNEAQVYELLQKRQIPFYSFNKKVTHYDLKNLALQHPLAAQIFEWRDMAADLNFLWQAAGVDRVHPEWEIMSRTGRIYASKPAVQNVNKTTCRPLLVAAPGWVLLKADYKQMQMRLLANFSKDPELVKAFQEGKDVHQLTAQMCNIQGASNKEKRDRAKEVNFGILFQMTPWGLAKRLNTNVGTAKRYIDTFWSHYSVAREYLDELVENLKNQTDPKRRFIEGASGRRRLFDKEFGAKEQREARATILQQAEAEVLTLAVISLYGIFRTKKMRSRIVMIIHDCIWVESPEGEAEQARKLMKHIMTNAVEFPLVPLEIEFE